MFKKIHIVKKPETTAHAARIKLTEKLIRASCEKASVGITNCIKEADLIIVIGGDGTMLRTAQLAIEHKKPLAGVFVGKLGFLTSYSIEREEDFQDLLAGKYKKTSNHPLHITCGSLSALAINEIVVHRPLECGLNHHKISIDNQSFHIQADGIIISSSIGSSAYNLSNGGPLIHPGLACMCLTAISPHSLNVRPIALSEKSHCHIISHTRNVIFIDGHDTTLPSSQPIEVKVSEKTLTILHPSSYSYAKRVIDKLHWTKSNIDSPRDLS